MESEKLYSLEDDKYVQKNRKMIKGFKYLTFFASMLLLLNGSFFDKNIAEHKKKVTNRLINRNLNVKQESSSLKQSKNLFIDNISKEIILNYVKNTSNSEIVVIDKTAKKLYLFEDKKLDDKYPVPIALGFDPIGDKIKRGDGRTPEGEFYLYSHVLGHSQFGYFMGISYPNKIAAKRGLESRLINKQQYNSIINKLSNKQRPPMNTALGGQVGIHTIKNGDKYIYGGITRNNWTYGCIAL